MLNKKDLSKYKKYDEQLAADSPAARTTSNDDDVVRFRITDGDNYLWLMPLSEEVEDESPFPWRFFSAHYEPFYTICSQGLNVLTYDKRSKVNRFVRPQGKSVEDCLLCSVNMGNNGPRGEEDRGEWIKSARGQEWKRLSGTTKAVFYAVPVNFLTEEVTSGRRSMVVARKDAPDLMVRWAKEYTAFLKGLEGQDLDPLRPPAFEFEVDGIKYPTGIQQVVFSGHVWAIQDPPIANEMMDRAIVDEIESWGVNAKGEITTLLNIRRMKKSGTGSHTDIDYRLELVEKLEIPVEVDFLTEVLGNAIPRLDLTVVPEEESAVFERYKQRTGGGKPDCFARIDIYDRFSEKCHGCSAVVACSQAIVRGEGHTNSVPAEEAEVLEEEGEFAAEFKPAKGFAVKKQEVQQDEEPDGDEFEPFSMNDSFEDIS